MTCNAHWQHQHHSLGELYSPNHNAQYNLCVSTTYCTRTEAEAELLRVTM